MELTREHVRAIIFYNFRSGLSLEECIVIIIIIILAQTPEIEHGLGNFLSYGARKPEQFWKDILIIVDSEPPPFFMINTFLELSAG